MKKIFLGLITMLICLSSFAKSGNDNTTYIKVIEASNSIIVKNNNIMSLHNYFEDSDVSLTIMIDNNKIIFNPYSKMIINNKIFLIGIGNYNINIICIDGNNICIPISQNKKIVIENESIANYIKNNTEDIPENNNILANI